jgi:hypothetical protein
MSIILFKVNAHITELSYGIKQASHNAVRETVWNIAPVNEYEAQSAIIPFVGIIIGKKKSCNNNVTSLLLIGMLQH